MRGNDKRILGKLAIGHDRIFHLGQGFLKAGILNGTALQIKQAVAAGFG